MTRLITFAVATLSLFVAAPAMAGTVTQVRSAISINAPRGTRDGFAFAHSLERFARMVAESLAR